MIFDEHRVPEPTVVDDCVHCGFCLETCPTYALWAQEADSPRGRIVLVDEALNADGEFTAEMVSHFDSCLGCMACVTACPSGVRYDRLIERVRPQIERGFRRPWNERALRRLLFETLPYPRRLRTLSPLLAAGRRLPLPASLRTLLDVAPRRVPRPTRIPLLTPAVGERRGRVGLLLGCVQRVFYPQVHLATIGALAAEGFDVIAPGAAGCCGALELHGGKEQGAASKARAMVNALPSGLDYIVVNAAGCGSAMKEYGELLDTAEARAFSDRVRDVTELLGAVPARAARGPVPLSVAYHDACHLAHAQNIRQSPRELLRAIPELKLLEVAAEAELCCGSAGIYNLVRPVAAAELGRRKATHVLGTGADAVAAANPGCAAQLDLHLGRLGRQLPIYHPVELVWRSIRAARST
jgi:glycolate dehydrogenase iron-sulfur subunit